MNPATINAEHARAVRLTQADLNTFRGEGVPPLAVARSCWGDYAPIARDRVVFEGGRFEFARYRPEAKPICAYVMVLLGDGCEPLDLLAFGLGGLAATWNGAASMAGEEQVAFPRLGEPLDAHATVLDWLRADRRGIVILDHPRAADRLVGATLRTATVEHARGLRARLTRPVPQVVLKPARNPVAFREWRQAARR